MRFCCDVIRAFVATALIILILILMPLMVNLYWLFVFIADCQLPTEDYY